MTLSTEHAAPVKEKESRYLASILLLTDAYETESDRSSLEAMHNMPSEKGNSASMVTQGLPTLSFIERVVMVLFDLPFAEMLTPFDEYVQRADDYEYGVSDPEGCNGIARTMSLDIRLHLGGQKDARMIIREVSPRPDGVLLVNFAFALPIEAERDKDLASFRAFLLALCDAYPVLVGTLGVNRDATTVCRSFEALMFFEEFVEVASTAAHGDYDFIMVPPAASGLNKPYVHDRIAHELSFPVDEEQGKYYDLLHYHALAEYDFLGQEAYGKMYESSWPKDDRDDALGFLAKAMELARSLELDRYEAELKARYEHVKAVYNAQFRR